MSRSATTVSDGLKRVPPFPPVAAKLLNLLAKPEVETNEVAELISSDATFTARILQRVNSVEFGLVTPVTNVRQAVALLGLDLTRQLILTHATAAYARGALRTEELRRCWQHTVATAVLADHIANACGEFSNVAFTAGIMHDIGRLGLLVAYPTEYEGIIRDAASRCLDLLDFERDEFGMDHAEAGRVLAERWDLPAGLAQIAGRHHDPCEGTTLNLLGIVHVACRLADALGYEVVKPLAPLDIDNVLAELPARGRVKLGKSPAELRAQIEQSLAEYGSEQKSPTPEEGLALLAAVAPQEKEPSPATEPEPILQDVPAPTTGNPRKKIILAAVVVLVGLAATIALLVWKMGWGLS
ncbi:MAG TPA: HDOD domain-containing protein [Bryobacteraceae bacterium]|jgi:HD-like signal output (HDOD) protein|nr:HDOD domain-containing protein [Bryobacteraceae bacterium]